MNHNIAVNNECMIDARKNVVNRFESICLSRQENRLGAMQGYKLVPFFQVMRSHPPPPGKKQVTSRCCHQSYGGLDLPQLAGIMI